MRIRIKGMLPSGQDFTQLAQQFVRRKAFGGFRVHPRQAAEVGSFSLAVLALEKDTGVSGL